jgi:flagellar biosynthesis/type III secretory pathway protein FliH
MTEAQKNKCSELAREEAQTAYQWASRHLSEKNPLIAYELGVQAGFKLGYEQGNRDLFYQAQKVIDSLNSFLKGEEKEFPAQILQNWRAQNVRGSTVNDVCSHGLHRISPDDVSFP